MKKQIKLLAWLMLIALLVVSLSACNSAKRQNEKVIGTCAGYDVLYEELRYVTLSYKAKFEATYGKGIWEDPTTAEQYRESLEKTVWDIMRNNYAVLALCRDFMSEDLMNSDTIDDAVEEYMSEAIEVYGSKKALEAALAELNLTENMMRFTARVATLENELMFVLTEDMLGTEYAIVNDQKQFADWLANGNCVYVQHVYVSNDAGEDIEANRAAAEALRASLIEIGDDSTARNKLIGSNRNEETKYLDPYYIVRGVYTELMENAAFALDAANDVSEVIETPDGFYVLVRIADSEQILTANVPSLLKSYQWAELEKRVDAKKETISVELNEYGKTIDLLAIK